jgi:putative ABC transport system permease protein
MRMLDRKLLRDLWRLKWQAGAIALLIACGVAVSVMAFSSQQALRNAQARDYAQARFADVFATAKRAPLPVARDLARIDGVVAVDARALKAGLMQLPGLLRPATVRLIALPDDEAGSLNRIVLMQGRMPDPDRTDEAVVLKTFLDAAHLKLGDRASMVIDGRQMSFRIVGSALSAEFAFLPGPASLMPDDAHQAVFWAPRATVEKATGLGGAFSEVSMKLAPGAPAQAVMQAVDKALAPYGGQPSYARADQLSTKFQDDHIRQLGILALVIPPIFLIVAAALVHMVLGRVVETEHEHIGMLKAFGYTDLEASAPYLKLALLIGLVGALAGGLFGGWLGELITGVFTRYVRFTRFEPRFDWTAFLSASAVSSGAAVLGSLLAVRRAVRLSPAEAMQPFAPEAYHKGVLERFRFWRFVGEPSRMIVRSLERFPVRASFTAAGLGVSLSLLIGTQFMFGSIEEIVDQAYYRARHWTDVVGFIEVRDARAVQEAARLPGVIAAEPVRSVSARFRAGGREERAVLNGLEPQAVLERPLDGRDRPVALPGRGIVLSDSLARRLNLRAGDDVDVEVYEDRRPHALLPITATATDYAGFSAYMARSQLNALMGDGDVASGAELLTAQDRRETFYRAVADAPGIVAALSKSDTVDEWRGSIVKTLTVEMWFYLGFAAAIAFGIAYNIARVTLTDRARDLATLRVLGFGQVECAYILLGELLALTIIAIPAGLAGGFGLARLLVAAFSHEEMRLPAIITPEACGISLLAYLGAVLVAAVLVGQRIWSFDLVAVLKTRE